MFRKLLAACSSHTVSTSHRILSFEQFENRRMLAAMVDIVFLIDEPSSISAPGSPDSVSHVWLQGVVEQMNNAGFVDSLASKGITDVRYGLVGFSDLDEISGVERFAHSQVVDDTNFNQNNPTTFTDALFGNSIQLDTAIANLDDDGSDSGDGWDAIDHAIAEYDFREGAVAVLVLVQNEEGRVPLNPTLTRDGIFAALDSKNVILNSLVVGENQTDDPIGDPPDILFDPSFYDDPTNPNDNFSADIRILGVEADIADGVRDRQHDYRWFDTDTINSTIDTPTATTAVALQVSYNGSNTGESGIVATGKSVLIGKDLQTGIGLSTEGYSAKAVSFGFEDLIDRATGNPVIGATMDGSFGTSEFLSNAALGAFEFDFYNTTYNQLYVRRDGYINFQSSTEYSPSTNADLSQGGGVANEPIIAPLWDDFNDSGIDGALVWKVDGTAGTADHRLIVQWEQVAYTDDFSEVDPVTFQAVLFADGQMRFNYSDLDSYPDGAFSNDATVNDTGGINATVGIWSGSEDPVDLAIDKFVPGPHSIGGSTIRFDTDPGSEGVIDTNDSYVRMAWDTGGAAWDVGIITKFFDGSATTPEDAINTDELNALRDAFVDSLGDQILRAEEIGKAFRPDQVLRSINFGGPAIAAKGFEADPATLTADSTITTLGSTAIDTVSNSIPEVGSPSAKAEEVFRSARTVDDSNAIAENLYLSITTLDGGVTLQNGSYIVELFFSEIDFSPLEGGRVFDVLLEGQTVLTDYDIYADRSRITSFDADEFDAAQAFSNTGVVKRFAVDVRGGDGLQIDLVSEAFSTDPILSAVRILDAGPARIEDIIISGSNSVHDAYSFSETFSQGIHEFQTVPVGGADTVEVVFSEWVDVLETDLWLFGGHTGTTYTSAWNIVDFAFDDETFTARWRFDDPADGDSLANPFPADKLVIGLNFTPTNYIHDIAGNQLDSEWAYPMGLADPSPTSFPSGDANEGGPFFFTFVILPGDFDLDNDGDGAGFLQWQRMFDPNGTDNGFTDGDYDGDGDVDGHDLALWQASYGLDFSSWF